MHQSACGFVQKRRDGRGRKREEQSQIEGSTVHMESLSASDLFSASLSHVHTPSNAHLCL